MLNDTENYSLLLGWQESIAWVKKPEWDEFCADINRIVFDMMSCT